MSKHTPGPWVYAEYDHGVKVTTVAHCERYVIGLESDVSGGNYRNGDPSGDPEADTRLIAAAPDLLAALLIALNCMDMQCNLIEGGKHAKAWAKPMELARAAIAKATGEQQ